MTTHKLWLDLILKPHFLNCKFIKEKLETENEVFDLIVHLINNGMSLVSSLASSVPSINIDDITKRDVETKKINIIRFLVFKLLSYLKWNLEKISNTLPSIHQEFAFTEFKRFCEVENDAKECKNFATILYHQWVLYFVSKSKYPTKPTRIGIISSNQQLLDSYFVPPEVHENLTKKLQNICSNSVFEIENLITELESRRSIDVSVPTFESFFVDDSCELKFLIKKADKFDKSKFLDDIYYDLGKWHFLYEEYSKANLFLTKIKSPESTYKHLNGYRLITQAMLSKNYKIHENKENEKSEKKVFEYLNTVIINKENIYDFDSIKFTDFKKLIQIIKKFTDSHKDDEFSFLLKRLTRYLVFKMPAFYEYLDQNNKSILLNIEKNNEGMENNEVIEEGEINADEELTSEDNPELMLLDAIDPYTIIRIIPTINREPSFVKLKLPLLNIQPILFQNLSPADCCKCRIILVKANDLRNARYFTESRILYLSLLEDIQASNPPLAQMIRCELLHTDLEIFFHFNDVDERMVSDLEYKCLQFLQSHDKNLFSNFNKVMELICLFLLEYRVASIKEFVNSQYEILRFSACLAILTSESIKNEKKGKELWDFIVGLFIQPTSKYVMSFPRIVFNSSFADFSCKFRKSFIHNVLSTCLVKIYNIVKDNPSQMITIYPQYDSFPLSMPSNLINSIDIKALSLVVDVILRCYCNSSQSNVSILKYYAEFLLCEGSYAQSLKFFIQLIMLKTNHFTVFEYLEKNESVVLQLITCCNKLGRHTQSAILYQFIREPDYGLAFKELSYVNYTDSTDDLYEFIWDLNLLEYLLNLHLRRGEDERQSHVVKLISQLELNASNSESIHLQASTKRKSKFFHLLAKLTL